VSDDVIELVQIRVPWRRRRVWNAGDIFILGTEGDMSEFRIVEVQPEEAGEWVVLTLERTADALRFYPETGRSDDGN
jgi:hypothetical protein